MNNNGGALSFEATLNNRQFESQLAALEGRTKNFTATLAQEGSKWDDTFRKLGVAAAGFFTLNQGKELISDIVRVRGEFQQLDIALTTMLQSKQKADKLMGELVDFAATTPFGLKETAAAAKSLLAYGSTADSVKGELRQLGDLASGVSVPIGDLVYLYGTLRTQGRAYAMDIRQFAGRGIPIYAELAKVLGIATDKVASYVEQGRVGFAEVQKAIGNMTAAGSQFGGLMEAQSRSIPGQIERVKDAWDQALNAMGTDAQAAIEGSVAALANLVENYETVGKVLIGIVATYGTYKAAVIAVAALQRLSALTVGEAALALGAETTAKVDNAATTANLSRAIANETATRAAAAEATLNQARADVAQAAAQKDAAILAAKTAAENVAASRAKVTAIAQEIGAKRVLDAQNQYSIAMENAYNARKALSAASSEFLAKKTALEAAAKAGASEATLTTMRAEVSALAVKRAAAVESARKAAAEVAAAQASIAAAAEETGSKRLLAAQNQLNALTEKELIARKAALSAASEFNAARTTVETAARTANTASTVANQAATAANVATTNADTISQARLTAAQQIRLAVTNKLAAAQKFLNTSMLTNPYVLVAVAAVALTASIWALYDSTTAQERAQKALNDILAKTSEVKEELKTKIQSLLSVINSENETILAQLIAFEKLQRLFPSYFGNMDLTAYKTKDAKTQQQELNKAIDEYDIATLNKKYAEQKAKLEDLIKSYLSFGKSLTVDNIPDDAPVELVKQRDLYRLLGNEIENQKRLQAEARELEYANNLPVQERIKYYQQSLKELEIQRSALENILLSAGRVSDSFSGWPEHLQRVLDKLNLVKGILKAMEDPVKDYDFYEKAQKEAKAKYQGFPINQLGSAEAQKAKQEYKEATEALEKYRLTEKKAPKPKKIDVPLPVGSMGEYERLIKKAEEALKKIPTDQVQRVKDMHKTLEQLNDQYLAAKKAAEYRNWDETLKYMRQQYEVYEKAIAPRVAISFDAVDGILADGADTIFKDLLAGGKSYVDYLEKTIAPIQDRILNGSASDEDIRKYTQAKEELDSALGNTSEIEKYKQWLDSVSNSSEGGVKYLQALGDEMKALNNIPNNEKSGIQLLQAKEVKERLKQTNQEYANQLRSFLQQVKGSEEQRNVIEEKYRKLRDAANKKESSEKERDLKFIDKAELKELADQAYENSEAFKKMNDTFYGDSYKDREKHIKDLNSLLDEAIEKYKKTGLAADEANVKLIQKQKLDEGIALNNDKWQAWVNILQRAGEEFEGMEGAMGAIGALLNGAARGAADLANGLATAKRVQAGQAKPGEAESAVIGGATNLIGMFIASRKRKKAEREQRELNALSFQVQLNKALNDEIRLRTILSENVYFKDYAGRITDGMNAAVDATIKYNKAVDTLANNGKSLTGTKNTIDWANVASGAGAGASAGAIIGSYIPVLGTAIGAVIGAVVGGVVGLISTATKSLYGPLLEQYPQLIDANGQLNKSLAETLISTNQVDEKTKVWLQDLINASEAMEEARKQITDIVSELTGNIGTELRDVLVEAFESGEDAAYKFSKTVESTLENALSNLIYSAVFSKAFSSLQKNLEDSLLGSGKSFSQVFAEFLGQSKDLTDAFNKAMEAAQEEGKKFGFDLFNGKDKNGNNSAASGISRSITEETGSLISGQINALRVSQAAGLAVMKQHTAQFEAMIHYQRYLVSIDKRLAKLNETPWRALGYDENPE